MERQTMDEDQLREFRQQHMRRIRINGKQGRTKDFIPYEEARTWVSRLGFENYRQWLAFSKMRYRKGNLKGRLIRPKFIPSNPQCSYQLREQWESDSDFLGHTSPSKQKLYLPKQETFEIANSLDLLTSIQWKQWHINTKPKQVPMYPTLVYDDQEFLQPVREKFSKKRPFPTLIEAMKFIHKFKFTDPSEYKQWVLKSPDYNFPLTPEGFYKEFPGWESFLGKDINAVVETHKAPNSPVLYIASYPNKTPSNVFDIKIEQKGYYEVEAKRNRQQFKLIKSYKLFPEDVEHVYKLIEANCSEWWEYPEFYLVRNIHELMFQLDVLLVTV